MSVILKAIVVADVSPGRKSFLRQMKDWFFWRKKRFVIPTLQFISDTGERTPLINLEGSAYSGEPIMMPSKIDIEHYLPTVHNPNEYPVYVALGFIYQDEETGMMAGPRYFCKTIVNQG